MIKNFLGLWLVMVSHFAAAATVQVSVGELTTAIENAASEPDAVRRLVLEEIEQELSGASLALSEGELLYTDTRVDQLVEDGCTNTTIQRLTTVVTLRDTTSLAVTLESLFDPVVIALNMAADIDARGRAKQNFGVRLGRCVEFASDSFDFSAIGSLTLVLEVTLMLNPEWLDDQTLRLTPAITLEGELSEGQIVVDVDDSLLKGVLEDYLQSQLNELLSTDAIAAEIASLQQRVQEQLQASLGQDDPSSGNDGAIVIELPPANDDQIAALYRLLTPQARFPLTLSFLEAYRLPLLAALITDDDRQISELLSNAAECEFGGVLQTPLDRAPIYSLDSGRCVVAEEPITSGVYFGSSSCAVPFDFAPVSLSGFCAVALDKNRLGNGVSNIPQVGKWSWSAGSTFEFGVVSLAGKQQPFVQRSVYSEVSTVAGECALEMRVYKSNPTAQHLRSVVAFHGGSWQRRGSGFLGIEHMATHFTDVGYVVFAPFYRLIGSNDGTPACHHADLADITADINAAFDWVLSNQQRFGASGAPAVFGQSAGGHLALSLAANRPEEVASAALFYAPTDFADFANQVRAGAYDNEQGQRIIEAVTGMSVDNIDETSALIVDNSFPARVAEDPARYPPMFLLHGQSDSLLPARQSVRLCNGLAGDVQRGPANLSQAGLRSVFRCDDRGSELHLIAEGEHTLDLCLSDSLCLAGSAESAAETAMAVERMLRWIQSPGESTLTAESQGGAGGLSLWLLFWIGIISVLCNKNSTLCINIETGSQKPMI